MSGQAVPTRTPHPREAGETPVLLLVASLGSLVVTLAVLAYVLGRPEAPPSTTDVGSLESELRTLRSENAALAEDLAALTGRVEVLEARSVPRSTSAPAGPVALADGESEAVGAASVPDPEVGKEEVEAVVQKTVEEAMERRERSRFARMVGIDLDAFAEEMDLTEEQKSAVSELLGRYQERMMELFRGRRRGPPASEEERTARREEMATAVQTIRSEIVQEAGTILQPAQLAAFEEQLSMPGGGGPPGGGGMGGRRGR